ncbi:MAG: PAS domain-containing protein [Planctomycetales bacterium]|nr:PAS domain-containing protein [Planctomycetales bacterium]
MAERKDKKRTKSDAQSANPRIPVVALGASAGGLEALTQFFDQVPPDSGMAFVVVTHQHPGHTSLLPELLAKHTSLPVTEAKDGDRLEANKVFIAPSHGQLEVSHGALQLIDTPEEKTFHLPIDSFLRSLAEDQRERAICVILSGTGTDGTLGLRAIKGASGMVMVQEPESAKYAGMPDSAIGTGMADYVLAASDMPSQLVAYIGGAYLGVSEASTSDELAHALPKIFRQLRTRTGHDFSSYKSSTITRRVERRMNVHQIESPQVYASFLQEHPYEADQLFNELLITVTNFFRDREAFETLGANVHRQLESKSDDDTFRAWVPGCATGEEAYSVAIIINECLSALGKNLAVQVFGTDLDSDAIETARVGRYPEGIAGDMDAQRLQRYFTKEDNGYRIKKEIREMVVFAPQNIINDPPFTKLDLLSCRNLLIYFNSDLQERLMPVFHYALSPRGLLFLGTSETIGASQDLFEAVSKKWKLYRRRESATAKHPEFPLSSTDHVIPGKTLTSPKTATPRSATDLLKEHLMSAYVPPTVIVDGRGDIVHVQGKTGLYLELPSGHMSNNLIEMARDGLQLDLAAAVRHATASDKPVVHRNIKVKSNGDVTEVDISVQKISEPEPIRGLLMVTFVPALPKRQSNSTEGAEQPQDGRLEKLEHELRYMKETLQTTIEQYDTTNEELKSTNEELQSTNEELQSANEELEASKEEMQSLNEELQTVNAELSSKLDELSHTNDDMQNLLNSTEIATLFLDNRIQIKRFAKSATKVFKVREVDVGRHLGEIVHDLDYPDLVDDASRVLETLAFEEKEILTRDGNSCYRVRILPYRTSENMIDGVVITLIDIKEIREARDYAESIIASISEPFIVLDEQLRVISANSAFYKRFQLTRGAVEGRLVGELGTGQWDIAKLRDLLESVLPENSSFEGYEVDFEFPAIGHKTMLLSGRRLMQQPNRPGLVLLTFNDVADAR